MFTKTDMRLMLAIVSGMFTMVLLVAILGAASFGSLTLTEDDLWDIVYAMDAVGIITMGCSLIFIVKTFIDNLKKKKMSKGEEK